MTNDEKQAFLELIGDVHAFYKQELSKFSSQVWWQSMQPFDFFAVRSALGRHTMNPDTGQFCPKPADVVKMLGGTTQDAALVAWAKVERAIRLVGPYKSVTFDDALVHRVIDDMGGWIKFCEVNEHELPFRAKEFENRYRGFRMRSEIPEYSPILIGIAQASNEHSGHPVEPAVLLGNPMLAQQVQSGGSASPRLQVTPFNAAMLLLKEGTSPSNSAN
jgi:hypothetical protein